MEAEESRPRYDSPPCNSSRDDAARSAVSSTVRRTTWSLMLASIWVLMLALVPVVDAVFVPFENCLPQSILNSSPLQLQFTPAWVWAALNLQSPNRNLNLTVYGNVSGMITDQPAPPPDDPRWNDSSWTTGKIPDVNGKYTTLFNDFNVLTFTPYKPPVERFCHTLVHGQCPLGPAFYANSSHPSQLPAFSVSHDLNTTFSFTTINAYLSATAGDSGQWRVVCVNADITPGLTQGLIDFIIFVPLVVLIVVGIATVVSAIWSPWGTADPFRWTSNYGRDEDLIRLVTPGFGDCLQYIQFTILTGSLTLNYPGFFQPVVSNVGWSALMFNQSFVSHDNGFSPVQDGVYVTNYTRYGLERMGELVGMADPKDVWAGMVVWLLSIVAVVIFLSQSLYVFRWLSRKITKEQDEDLRSKTLPLTVGNVVRIVFNYFLFPIVSLSVYQFVVADRSPAYTVALAAVLLAVLVVFAIWLLWLIVTARPRANLFDDLPTLLLYGPLYNTYSDDAAPFSVISILLTIIRGIAVGAVQPSGVAQIVILIVCEVSLVLMLIAFRPFQPATYMNIYHGAFAVVRSLILLLYLAFIPSLGISSGIRGWVGYAVLFVHALVLLFMFFLNAAQTLIEVVARLLGAGGEPGMATRGGLVMILGKRQLARRHTPHHSLDSSAAMLGHNSRQISGDLHSSSSAMLTNIIPQTEGPLADHSPEAGDANHPSSAGSSTPYSPASLHSPRSRSSGLLGFRNVIPLDPYYRPPRQRTTNKGSHQGRTSSSGDWGSHMDADTPEDGGAPGPSYQDLSPTPDYLAAPGNDPDEDADDRKTDYAVREADFFYRARMPTLSHPSTKRFRTSHPRQVTPRPTIGGFLWSLFRGKTKEKEKGFEVVRSARAPPPGLIPDDEELPLEEPYSDNIAQSAHAGGDRSTSDRGKGSSVTYESTGVPTSASAPTLPHINAGGSIELPSRVGSNSSRTSEQPDEQPDEQPGEQPGRQTSLERAPTIPRKSSKRHSRLISVDHDRTSPSPSQLQTPGTPQFPFDTRSEFPSLTSHGSGESRNQERLGSLRTEAGEIRRVQEHQTSVSIHDNDQDTVPYPARSAILISSPTPEDNPPTQH